MRPTFLDFRNPKERTPQFYTPIVTNDGHKLYQAALVEPVVPLRKKRPKTRSVGFTSSRRFDYFKILDNRTLPKVGPGRYNPTTSQERERKKPCAAVMRVPVVGKFNAREGFIMQGSQLVFDPLYSETTSQPNQVKQFLSESIRSNLDIHNTSFQRSTASSFISSFRTSPRRMDSLCAPSLSSRPSTLRAAHSVSRVKQLLLDKIKMGVVVNPYYQGLLNKVIRPSSQERSLTSHTTRGFDNTSLSQNTSILYPKRISSTMSPLSRQNPSLGTFSNCTLNALTSLLDTIPTVSVGPAQPLQPRKKSSIRKKHSSPTKKLSAYRVKSEVYAHEIVPNKRGYHSANIDTPLSGGASGEGRFLNNDDSVPPEDDVSFSRQEFPVAGFPPASPH